MKQFEPGRDGTTYLLLSGRRAVHGATWPTRDHARRAIAEYIELFYNPQRRHSSLGYLSPSAFERQAAKAS